MINAWELFNVLKEYNYEQLKDLDIVIEIDREDNSSVGESRYAKEDGLKSFRIGRAIPCGIPNIDTDWLLERAQELLYDEVGESAEVYLDSVTREEFKELDEQLNEVFYQWHKKHKLEPNCYKVIDDEVIEVK